MNTLSSQMKLVGQLAGIFLLAASFFLGYNRFLVDHSLNDLTLTLNNIKSNKFDGVDKLLAYTLSDELQKVPPETYNVVALQYAKSVVSQHDPQRSMHDAEMVLNDLVLAKRFSRNRLLRTLDRLNEAVWRVFSLNPSASVRAKAREEQRQKIVEYDPEKNKNPILRKVYEATQLRQARQYDKAAEIYQEVAEKYPNNNVASLLLYQAGSTYENDLHDLNKADAVFKRVKKEYPTAIYSFKDAEDYAQIRRFIPIKTLQSSVDAASVKFTQIMVMRTEEKMEKEGIKVGQNFDIRPTAEQISAATKQYINKLLTGSPIKVTDFDLRFAPGNTVDVRGSGKIGALTVNGRLKGKLWLLKQPPKAAAPKVSVGKAENTRWVYFNVDEAQLGPITIPKQLITEMLAPCHKVFNENIPFSVETMTIDPATQKSIWRGPRVDRSLVDRKGMLRTAKSEEVTE